MLFPVKMINQIRYLYLQNMSAKTHLPVDQLGMLENCDNVADDSNAEVHHDVFTEVH